MGNGQAEVLRLMFDLDHMMHFIQLWVFVKAITVFAVMVCSGTNCSLYVIDSMLVFSDRLIGTSVLV